MGEHILLERRAEVLSVFPEAAAFYKDQCVDCLVAKVSGLVRSLLSSRDVSKMSFDIKAATMVPAPAVGPLKGFEKFPSMDAAEPRRACLECVLKHLAQSLILLSEASLGYPEHVGRAVWHLEKAGAKVPARYIKELSDIRGLLAGGSADLNLFLAGERIRAMASEAGAPFPLNYWKAIGHLAEASEECVEKYPAFASKLRNERLMMMADRTYEPPVAALLLELKELKENEPEGLSDGGRGEPVRGDGGQGGGGQGVS